MSTADAYLPGKEDTDQRRGGSRLRASRHPSRTGFTETLIMGVVVVLTALSLRSGLPEHAVVILVAGFVLLAATTART